ncbi:MAG: DegT/DnrJ/EryC1/StrS family aminotransferase [Proteobacteria bacterium]|nr:DegT/DnrJ/EryC1/StrS family aminotransferase [Pseudomonadota bacterium]
MEKTRAPRVPFLDLRAQYDTLRDEVEEAIRGVLESQRFILGPEVEAFEREIAAYSDGVYAVGCASGSDALLLALMALDVGPGDQVLCPAYTFFATAGSIWRLGAEPVFADIDPATYNLDPASAREQIARCTRLKAIIPVHLFGQAADMRAFQGLAREAAVPVIEDAAQAIGARDAAGQRVGARDTLACLSFFPSKNLGGTGDGGMLLTRRRGVAERLTALRSHGALSRDEHVEVGLNSRLDALHAAVLRVKLRHLDQWTKRRQENASFYDQHFGAAGAQPSSQPLAAGGLPLRTPAPASPPAGHTYNQYVIRVPAERRDSLREHLADCGVATAVYYPSPLHLQDCFASLGGQPGQFPAAEAAACETIALPIYPELTHAQRDHVVASVLAGLRSA